MALWLQSQNLKCLILVLTALPLLTPTNVQLRPYETRIVTTTRKFLNKLLINAWTLWEAHGLVVRGLGSSSSHSPYIVFLGKGVDSHNSSLHPGVQICKQWMVGQPAKVLRGNHRRSSIPSNLTILPQALWFLVWEGFLKWGYFTDLLANVFKN